MSEPAATGERPEAAASGRTRTGLGRAGRWVRGRSARWVAAGAAVVVLGGGAAAVAVHHEGERHGDDRQSAAGDVERHDGHANRGGHAGHGNHEGHSSHREDGRGASQDAPAPLPATDAADAVAKAASAVAGGKVESLNPVAEQGGGRAWQAVVLGPDGVRHLVTVDGTGGTVTGNTVLGG
ncbi:hypothetical protein [Streptomyces sp. FH025]|uniref:hypothetical protein n=1 Tax=Streptomyces sp. FH025 TaxID=2815937 RepID=UPI001AA00081|nr:hypothetical protein [Streptomyces sp. FH025]MBO1414224.1 hypothetical protein [Streptomyces sp. FH025]